MMKPKLRIAFLHSGKAFLPGIKAYAEYFSERNIECISVNKKTEKFRADVHWHFMGRDRSKKIPGTFLIHEYASASVPPFNNIKDLVKKSINSRPDLRVFLNTAVEEKMNFSDGVPVCYRDVGIYPSEKKYNPQTPKEYDFIFTGAVTHDMQFENFLKLFISGPLKHKNILILGRVEEKFRAKYIAEKNIVFHNAVPQSAVTDYLSKARVAVNYKPDLPPYSFQTSTKLLEYLNFGIPVMSTRNRWVDEFIQESGAGIYLLNNDLSNINIEQIESYPYHFPDMEIYSWKLQIEKSGLPEIIENLAAKKNN